jgi:hypothetical protein
VSIYFKNCQARNGVQERIRYAEFCAPLWLNSVHVNKVDVQLNNAMRLTTDTVKSTPLQWLPVLSNIAPPTLQDGYRILDRWRESWLSNVSANGDIVDDPSAVHPGFDLKRREWVVLNLFRTSQGKLAHLMHA